MPDFGFSKEQQTLRDGAREGPVPGAVAVVVGTRPEALKLSPVIHALAARCQPVRVIATGQQQGMVEACLAAEQMAPAAVLAGPGSGSLGRRLARLTEHLRRELAEAPPPVLLVQGDTLSACAGALAAGALGVPVGHVEAGLRSHHLRSPFPEEALRRRISRVARLHFAPNLVAAENLLREGVPAATVHVVGNPGIDRLRRHVARAPLVSPTCALVVTLHRHEHRGSRLEAIVAGLRAVLAARPGLEARVVLHPNPLWGATQHRLLGSLAGAVLLPPLPYAAFVQEMRAARLIVSDSGGVQEEVPYLGVPAVIVREATERPTSLAWPGCVRAAPEAAAILAAARRLLDADVPEPCGFDARAPHGDGSAAGRIAEVVMRWLAPADDARVPAGAGVPWGLAEQVPA